MAGVRELTPVVGNAAACRALGPWRGATARSQARSRRAMLAEPPTARPAPPLALTPGERQALLDTLNNERFVDTAPAPVHATLLDEGRYLGSVRTMYRLLAADGGCRERRALRRHATYSKPELLATAPNQVWSWDITKLKGPKAEDHGYDEEVRLVTKRLFDQADVFILTFGLSEIWYDEPTGGVFWRAVPQDKFDPARHKFRVASYAETLDRLHRIHSLIRAYRPSAKIICLFRESSGSIRGTEGARMLVGSGFCGRSHGLLLCTLKIGAAAVAVGMWAKASISPRSQAVGSRRHGTRGKRSRSAKRIVHISTAFFGAPKREAQAPEQSSDAALIEHKLASQEPRHDRSCPRIDPLDSLKTQ